MSRKETSFHAVESNGDPDTLPTFVGDGACEAQHNT